MSVTTEALIPAQTPSALAPAPADPSGACERPETLGATVAHDASSVGKTAGGADRLNTRQREAVEYGIDGAAQRVHAPPLLVIAGAGSGKTHTLVHRVARLIRAGAQPERIMLLTFSRRAAAEMNRRVERLLTRAQAGPGMSVPGGVLTWSGTFHAIGARLLREYAGSIGLAPTFTIADREDAADLLNMVRHDQGLSAKAKRFPHKNTALAIYSRAVNTECALDQVLAEAFPWCLEWEAELRRLFAGYVQAKQAQQVLDYDDLLLYWSRMAEEPVIAADLGRRFEHVLVDEYQDTNRLQASILLAMKPDGQGLTVVGDDAQSIYSFRGATVENILSFPDAFRPAARIVTLDQNYRSTPPILAAANAVIALAGAGFVKHLWSSREGSQLPRLITLADEAEQARYVASRILEQREAGCSLRSQAVLFRTASHSAALEIELTRRNIPFVKYGGLRFLDASHVKDVLAMLRWAQNPLDRVAGFRVLQLLPGVGPARAAQVIDTLAAGAIDGHALLALEAMPAPGAQVEGWEAFRDTVVDLAQRRSPWPAEFQRIRQWYEPQLERIHDDAAARAADLLQLEQIAATFGSRERFLAEVTLDPPDASSGESGRPLRDEDYLVLSTIHSAKGQEWRNVFVLNGVDGCLPSDLGTGSDADIDEERRLLYVAMTRAKENLEIILPQRFYTHHQPGGGDRHVYAARTRFIPPRLLGLFASSSWPCVQPTAVGESSLAAVRVDLAARMRDMWT